MWNEDTVYQSIINSKNTERERRSRCAVALEERVITMKPNKCNYRKELSALLARIAN